MMSSETQIIRLLRAQAQKAPEFGMAGMASPTFDAAPPDATPEACRTALTALLFFTGILRLISQKLRFVHYVQCRRLRSP